MMKKIEKVFGFIFTFHKSSISLLVKIFNIPSIPCLRVVHRACIEVVRVNYFLKMYFLKDADKILQKKARHF